MLPQLENEMSELRQVLAMGRKAMDEEEDEGGSPHAVHAGGKGTGQGGGGAGHEGTGSSDGGGGGADAEEILPKEAQPEEVRRKVESVLRFVQCEESRAEVALTFASGGEEEENRVEMEAAVKQFVSWRGYGVAALFSEEL